jgi:hypothetical protein
VLENACFLLEQTADRVLLRSSTSNDSAWAEFFTDRELRVDPKELKAA